MKSAAAFALAVFLFAACGVEQAPLQRDSVGAAHSDDQGPRGAPAPTLAGDAASTRQRSQPGATDATNAGGPSRPSTTATSGPTAARTPVTTTSAAPPAGASPATTAPRQSGAVTPPSAPGIVVLGPLDPTKRPGRPGISVATSYKLAPVAPSPTLGGGRLEVRNTSGQSLQGLRVVMQGDTVTPAVSKGVKCTTSGADVVCEALALGPEESLWIDVAMPKGGEQRVFRLEAVDAEGDSYVSQFTGLAAS